jgi:hypothetical protein
MNSFLLFLVTTWMDQNPFGNTLMTIISFMVISSRSPIPLRRDLRRYWLLRVLSLVRGSGTKEYSFSVEDPFEPWAFWSDIFTQLIHR